MRLGRCRVDVGCDGIDPKMWTVRLGFFVLAVLLFAAGHWAGAGTAGEVHTVVRRVLSPVPQVEPAAAPLWGAASVTRLRDVALDYTVGSAMSPADASTPLLWPARGHLISTFGRRENGALQPGMRVFAPRGTPVVAAAEGIVVHAGNGPSRVGKVVMLQHAAGMVTVYAHLAGIEVVAGDEVRAGEVIGRVGATGAIEEPQLYFELRVEGRPRDPLLHLRSLG